VNNFEWQFQLESTMDDTIENKFVMQRAHGCLYNQFILSNE